jgi:cytochrome P450
MEVKYTKLVTDADIIIHAVKSDLTPSLCRYGCFPRQIVSNYRIARLNSTICVEVDNALKEYIPPCEEWTEVALNGQLVKVVAKVSGRIFVGPDLCQDPEYLDSGSNYTINLMKAVHAIKQIRPWLRPFVVPRLPEIKKLRNMEERAARHLEPIVRERMEAEKNDPNWQKPDDMMQWLLNQSAKHGTVSVEQLAKMQLALIFAAIHTTTMTLTNILYTLAVTPEYVGPLREEIVNVMSDNDGKITTRALQQMVKLDSYMKEVTRLYPPSVSTYLS